MQRHTFEPAQEGIWTLPPLIS